MAQAEHKLKTEFAEWEELTGDGDFEKFKFYRENTQNFQAAIQRKFDADEDPDSITTLEYRFANQTNPDLMADLSSVISVRVKYSTDGDTKVFTIQDVDSQGTIAQVKNLVRDQMDMMGTQFPSQSRIKFRHDAKGSEQVR